MRNFNLIKGHEICISDLNFKVFLCTWRISERRVALLEFTSTLFFYSRLCKTRGGLLKRISDQTRMPTHFGVSGALDDLRAKWIVTGKQHPNWRTPSDFRHRLLSAEYINIFQTPSRSQTWPFVLFHRAKKIERNQRGNKSRIKWNLMYFLSVGILCVECKNFLPLRMTYGLFYFRRQLFDQTTMIENVISHVIFRVFFQKMYFNDSNIKKLNFIKARFLCSWKRFGSCNEAFEGLRIGCLVVLKWK